MNDKELPKTVTGLITRHEGNGSKLGYPTANIKAKVSLQDGVYFGFADLDTFHSHPALIFIGKPITVGSKEHRIEAHLLDIPNRPYYGNTLILKIHHFHRANQMFDTIDDLIVAMKLDEATARAWFKRS